MESNRNEPLIDEIQLRKGAAVLRALNHQLRQKMMRLIHEKGRMTVTSIFTTLGVEQSVASQHLAILRRQRFLLTEREGKYIFYSVNYQSLDRLDGLVRALLLQQE